MESALDITANHLGNTVELIEQYEIAMQHFKHYVPAIVQLVLFYTLDLPLFHLYRNGPSVLGVGFWNGQAYEQVCAQITRVDASFWANGNMDTCHSLIQRRFDGFLIMLYVPAFYLLLVLLIAKLSTRAFTGTQTFCRLLCTTSNNNKTK